MSEYYVTVRFSVPEDRKEEINNFLEKGVMGMDTDTAIKDLSKLGEGIQSLLENTNEDGGRDWLDDQLTLEEQLEPQEWNIDDNNVEIEYMCDSWVGEDFTKFVIKLFQLAGMKNVTANEFDEDEMSE